LIFDETTLRKLNQLTLVASRVRAGAIKGERRSSRRGGSVEFADYRNYTPGDDLRRLDWNIYARLDRPFIKLLEEEEDLAVHILLDGSRSMDWGEGEIHKFNYALRLTAGLGAIALASGDVLSIGFLQAGHVIDEYGPTRGQASLPRLFNFLDELESNGETNLNNAVREYLLPARRPGLAIVISDLLVSDGHEAGLRLLRGRGFEVALIHVLSPDELDPPLAGDLQLIDIETGQSQDISLDGGLREQFRTKARSWIHTIQVDSRKQDIRYLQLTTDLPWDQALLLEMRRSSIVK
jgi:uncharacterized protein (DUF58 family)